MTNNNNRKQIPSMMTPGVLYGDPSAFPDGKPVTNLMRVGDTVGNPNPNRSNTTKAIPPRIEFKPGAWDEGYEKPNTTKAIPPRIEFKPGPWDEGYEKPNTTMEPEQKATLSEWLNPGPKQETRTNANDVVQSGLNTGGGVSAAFVPEYANSSFNDLLAAQGNQRYQGFNSSQLPETAGNPFSGTAPKTDTFNPLAPGITGGSLADFGGDKSAAFAQSRETTANDTFNPDAARIEGGSSRKVGGSLSEALADTAGINSYMSKFSSGDRERAASSAFLNAEDSLSGLQARDAVQGKVYAGGQHYVAGKSGDDPAVAIDRSAARAISNGTETAAGASQKAQDFLAKKTADTVAAVKQAPTLLEDGARDGAFQQDKPMVATNATPIGGGEEFYSNNDNAVKPFGDNGGYASGFKRIDTSMTNPFGG